LSMAKHSITVLLAMTLLKFMVTFLPYPEHTQPTSNKNYFQYCGYGQHL